MKKGLFKYLAITLGCVLYAGGIGIFLDPNGLAPGGVTGIAIILSHVTGLSTGLLTLALNLPLLALGLWKFGREFLFSTVYATVVSSLMIDGIASALPAPVTADPMLSAIAGGVAVAAGMGIIFRCHATTGGTDIVVKLIRRRRPYVKTGAVFMATDAAVVIASAFAFGNIENALHASVSIAVCAIVLDLVLYGPDSATLVYIVSAQHEAIAAELLQKLDIGATFLDGAGAYSGKATRVVMCVMRKQLFPDVREIVRSADPGAFMIVSSAAEIYGEGYKGHFDEGL